MATAASAQRGGVGVGSTTGKGSVVLAPGLWPEGVRDLVDVSRILLEMYAVRAGICDLREKACWQLALDVEVPLLDVSVLRITVPADPEIRGQGWAVLRCNETGHIGCGGECRKIAPRRQDDPG